MASEPAGRRRFWTDIEDSLLRRAVSKHGSSCITSSNWSRISADVGHDRTPKDCKKRWLYTLDPALRKGRWSKEEDEILRRAFADVGPSWRKIASRIPGRNDEQVAKRWRDVLSPDLNLDAPWTVEEDVLLKNLYRKHGAKWTLMSDSFPGRNGIACRNRFRSFKISTPPAHTAAPSTNGSLYPDLATGSSFILSESLLRQDSLSSADFSDLTHLAIPNSGFPFEYDSPVSAALSDNAVHIDNEAPVNEKSSVYYCGDQIGEPRGHDPSAVGINESLSSMDGSNIPTINETPQTPFGDWLHRHLLQDVASESGLLPAEVTIPQFLEEHAFSEASDGIPRAAVSTSSEFLSEPIRSVWALVVALESGRDSLTLSTELIQRLIDDACRV